MNESERREITSIARQESTKAGDGVFAALVIAMIGFAFLIYMASREHRALAERVTALESVGKTTP